MNTYDDDDIMGMMKKADANVQRARENALNALSTKGNFAEAAKEFREAFATKRMIDQLAECAQNEENRATNLRGLIDYLGNECANAKNNFDLSHDFPQVVNSYLEKLK